MIYIIIIIIIIIRYLYKKKYIIFLKKYDKYMFINLDNWQKFCYPKYVKSDFFFPNINSLLFKFSPYLYYFLASYLIPLRTFKDYSLLFISHKCLPNQYFTNLNSNEIGHYKGKILIWYVFIRCYGRNMKVE